MQNLFAPYPQQKRFSKNIFVKKNTGMFGNYNSSKCALKTDTAPKIFIYMLMKHSFHLGKFLSQVLQTGKMRVL